MEHIPRPYDKGLVELAFQAHMGSEEAWGKLLQTIEKVVRRCRLDQPKILKCGILKSDLVQEVAIKVHQGMGQFRGKTPQELIIWFTAITQHLIDDYYRKLRTSIRGAGEELSLESLEEKGVQFPARQDQPDFDEQSQRIAQSVDAVARLPYPYFWVIEMHAGSDLTFREIGPLLHCTEDAAKKMYYRGLKILRKELRVQQ